MSNNLTSNTTYYRIASDEEADNRKKIHICGQIEFVTVYFKQAYTSNLAYYNIPINWSMNYFLNSVIEWLKIDFNIIENYINRNNVSESIIDFIEMGQEIHGVNSEDAPKLYFTFSSGQETFYEKYINSSTNNCPGFYFKIN